MKPLGRRSEQVRSADVADEERVAGEDPVGDGVVGVLEDQHAYGLRSVARGRPDLQGDLSKSYALAVDQWLGREVDGRRPLRTR